MNVYFIDPTYVKPEAWKPLLTYLKVKAAWSFMPKNELPESLFSIIKPYLKSSYSNQDLTKFTSNCVYWLKGHFEKHIDLIPNDYIRYKDIPREELENMSSLSAIDNIRRLDDSNCLILMKLNSSIDSIGDINTSGSSFFELPTKISIRCLSILHKMHGHSKYQYQSAFITFDEYFSSTYLFIPWYRRWTRYYLRNKNRIRLDFMNYVLRGVKDNSPEDFPIIDVDGRKLLSRIRNQDGDLKYKAFHKIAYETKDEYLREIEEQRRHEAEADDWSREVDEMNRAFWRECGESGSNCESWPGWDD